MQKKLARLKVIVQMYLQTMLIFSSPGTNALGEVLSYPRRRRCRCRRCRRQFQVKVSVY